MKEERINQIIKNSPFLNNFTNKPEFLKKLEEVVDKVTTNWKTKEIIESNEPLIALNSYDETNQKFIQLHKRIFPNPIYFKQNIKEAMPIIYSRAGIVNLLLKVIDLLPEEYGILLYDGYRPVSVQTALYNDLKEQERIKEENKNCTEEELDKITTYYIALPSLDPTKPSTHNTGGAIDFSICDKNGNEINFGGIFDDFSDISNITYFEEKFNSNEEISDNEIEAMLNRRVLSNIGLSLGFCLFRPEWWHFDAYNQYDLERPISIYGSCDLNNIIPNPENNLTKYIQDNKDFHHHLKYLN